MDSQFRRPLRSVPPARRTASKAPVAVYDSDAYLSWLPSRLGLQWEGAVVDLARFLGAGGVVGANKVWPQGLGSLFVCARVIFRFFRSIHQTEVQGFKVQRIDRPFHVLCLGVRRASALG